jgi:hypothetical protein
MGSEAAIVAIHRKKLLNKFRTASATNPEMAILPAEHGIRTGLIFKRLVRQRILVQTHNLRYYLDETREGEVRHVKLQVVIAIVIIFMVFALILLFSQHK